MNSHTLWKKDRLVHQIVLSQQRKKAEAQAREQAKAREEFLSSNLLEGYSIYGNDLCSDPLSLQVLDLCHCSQDPGQSTENIFPPWKTGLGGSSTWTFRRLRGCR